MTVPEPRKRGSVRVVAVSGGMNPASSTRRLIDLVAADVEKEAADLGLDLAVTVIDIRDWANDVTRMSLGGPASLELGRVLAQVERANGLIVASPVYKGAYSGLFKSFFDVVDPHALIHTPVLLAGTGGSLRHALMIEHSLRPLFSFFQAITVPTGVFGTNADCSQVAADAPGDELAARSRQAATEFVSLIDADRLGT